MTLEELYNIIEERAREGRDDSYTVSLLREGIDRIAQKVGEEAVETVIASKNDNTSLFVGEVSDLLYHLLVLLSVKGVRVEDVMQELERRHNKC